jgi:8-oxo-dGTP diphosphatase
VVPAAQAAPGTHRLLGAAYRGAASRWTEIFIHPPDLDGGKQGLVSIGLDADGSRTLDTEPMQAITGLLDEIYSLVDGLRPFDDLEARHRSDCLAWLRNTDDVFRRETPRTPSPHLVAYALLRDDQDGSVLLVDHIKSGLWLPAGGHVEPGEHPVETVRREVAEELRVSAVFLRQAGERPFFLTVTETVGTLEHRHTDVSLWFVLSGSRDQVFTPDLGEFRGIRWWTPEEVNDAQPETLDPHLRRMLAKLATL